MLTNDDIKAYNDLQSQTQEAIQEQAALKAEIAVFVKQGKEKLAKYGFDSFSDIPKLKEKLQELEDQVIKEKEAMTNYCTYMATKKMEKMAIFNKEV